MLIKSRVVPGKNSGSSVTATKWFNFTWLTSRLNSTKLLHASLTL